jgi:hypothetical protein
MVRWCENERRKKCRVQFFPCSYISYIPPRNWRRRNPCTQKEARAKDVCHPGCIKDCTGWLMKGSSDVIGIGVSGPETQDAQCQWCSRPISRSRGPVGRDLTTSLASCSRIWPAPVYTCMHLSRGPRRHKLQPLYTVRLLLHYLDFSTTRA